MTSSPRLLLPLFFFILCSIATAAPLRFFPMELRQPDGSILHCYASGDEYYNWLHDKNGYTIIQDRATGWYTYAIEAKRTLVPSQHIPGLVDPATIGVAPWARMRDRVAIDRQFHGNRVLGGGGEVLTPTKGVINNIVIFIRFNDDPEFTTPIATYEDMFNTGQSSMRNYFADVSHGALDVSSTFYPKTTTTTVLSFRDSHPRQYFMPQSETEPLGYGNDRDLREHTLLRDAVDAVANQIPADLVVDSDGDGNVDNVCFIVSGSPTAWSTLLWPHMWTINSFDVRINKARIRSYNFQINNPLMQDRSSVLCHEMQHSLGFPDLYHYSYDGLAPAASWDIMEQNRFPPQHSSMYMKWRYGKWVDSIPEIRTSGRYFLQPSTALTNNCFKIVSPYAPKEFFVLEFRRRNTNFDRSIPNEGLLVWRVNSTYDGRGNSNGPPDEVYLYRPGGTVTEDGSPSIANFSANSSRTAINDKTDPSSFLTLGGRGGLDVSEVGPVGDSIWFTVNIIVPKPPMKPSVLVPTATSFNTILLQWKDNADDESGFEIQTRRENSSWTTILTTPPDIQSVPIAGCFPETFYWFRMRAFNGQYLSEWTDSAGVMTPAAPRPRDFSAIPLDERMVRLGWTNPTIEDRPIEIQRLAPNGTWVRIDSVFGQNAYFDRSGLTPGTSYCYRIRALYGNAASQWSDTACAKPGILVLHAPTRLRSGTVTPLAVQLYWDFDSFGESGFEVERSESGGAASYTLLEPVAGPGFDVYIDRDVLPGETWFYRVRTTKSSQRSSFSPVTTMTVPEWRRDAWERMNGPESGRVHGLAVRGAELFAATEGAGVLRSTDNGGTWFTANGNLSVRTISAIAVNDNVLLAGTPQGWLYRSVTRGESWELVGRGLPEKPIETLAFAGPSVFVAQTGGGVHHSTDDGENWSAVADIPGIDAHCLAVSGSLIFAGTADGVYRSISGGATWEKSSTGMVHTDVRALAFGQGAVLAGTELGGVYRSTDNGSSWMRQPRGIASASVHALLSAGGRLYAGTAGSGMFTSIDNGTSWEPWNAGFTDSVVTALALRDTTIFAGTAGSGLLRTTPRVSAWASVNSGFVGGRAATLIAAGNDILAATMGGGVTRSKTAGVTWTPASYGIPATDIRALAGNGSILLAGTACNGVYRSTNNGSTWKQSNRNLSDTAITAIACAGTVALVGTRSGAVHRSDDEGLTWMEQSGGLADSTITLLTIINSVRYAGVAGHGLHRMSATESAWTHIDGLPASDVHALTVFGTELVAATGSGVFRSADNGGTWVRSDAGLPTDAFTALTTASTAVFVGSAAHGVHLARAGVQSWRDINPALWNMRILALHNDGRYLYAGTEGGVWRLDITDILTDHGGPRVAPVEWQLEQNQPNPFATTTLLRCTVPEACTARITVTDLLGRVVAEPFHGPLTAGTHSVMFDAGALPSGAWFCTLRAEGVVRTIRMIKR